MTTWGSWTKTGVTMAQGWTGTLTIANCDDGYTAGAFGFGQLAQVDGMGCTASIDRYSSGASQYMAGSWGSPPAGFPADAQTAWSAWFAGLSTTGPGPQGSWVMYRCLLTTPGGSSATYHVTGEWREKLWASGPPGPPEPWTWVGPFTSVSATYNLYLKDVYLHVRGGLNNPTTRQVRDFIDQHVEYAWFGEAGATDSGGTLVTPTATLASSGTWGSHPGAGAFGSTWGTICAVDYTLGVSLGGDVATDYATIAPQWAGVDLKLDKLDDRYYSGAWHHKPYPTTGWPPGAWEWQAGEQAGAISLRRNAATAVDGDWTGWSLVPYVLSFNVAGGRWS